MKKTYESEDSESVDEPDQFQESSDDWTPGSEGPRRQPRRQRKKLRRDSSSSEDSTDSDDSENVKKPKKGKPVLEKKSTCITKPKGEGVGPEGVIVREATSTTSPVEKEFSSGAFVILKDDLEKNENPPIWKIDGKALLQKYVPKEEEKSIYQSTSTYSGWSVSNKHKYKPIKVTPKTENRKDSTVEFLKNEMQISPASEAQDSD